MSAPFTPAATPEPDFSGLWIPLVTPFDGPAVDHAALAALARRLAAQGVRGFVVCGSTGEAAALTEDEQLAALKTVRDAVPQLPCIMGLGGENLPHVLGRLEQLNTLDLQGLLVPAPSYIRPSQDGLLRWFTRIADASRHPLVIYDIPYRTGVTLQLDTLRALAAHPRIRAIKDCSGDGAKLRALLQGGELQVLAGEDLQIFGTVAEGGVGAISASAHIQTVRFAEVIAWLRAGRLEAARERWRPLPALIEALFAHPNPACIKALLACHGELQNTLREPMTAAPPALLARLQALDAAAA
ncbi:dihydrodipicolinate synthase family protein [Xenophilus arseniciresistens]|uniref:4-hydroxy-tetrahydrodipicolinate synthase n=1 Tax=Xenophilus arseniciresistens TaxID=1283306 RepID=A0AAE3SZV8_9BURK|nr:dihydrodipicolinate synthase family protein [Xenophilus arseniciresistens]MDA7415657.1 dihydrodipicolinate synthase family protein [Xenophilus arseniciresistens]